MLCLPGIKVDVMRVSPMCYEVLLDSGHEWIVDIRLIMLSTVSS